MEKKNRYKLQVFPSYLLGKTNHAFKRMQQHVEKDIIIGETMQGYINAVFETSFSFLSYRVAFDLLYDKIKVL